MQTFAMNRQRSLRPSPQRHPVEIAPLTQPLNILNHHDVLVIADSQNIDLGARDLGFKVAWKKLGLLLDENARLAQRHVFLSQPTGDNSRALRFANQGWTPHSKVSRQVRTVRGLERKSNIDHMLAFFTGLLVSQMQASLLLVCSGDGDLVEDISESIGLLRVPCRIATLSVAGSTAQRLDARFSPFIAANMELGLDCLCDLNATSTRKDYQYAI